MTKKKKTRIRIIDHPKIKKGEEFDVVRKDQEGWIIDRPSYVDNIIGFDYMIGKDQAEEI